VVFYEAQEQLYLIPLPPEQPVRCMFQRPPLKSDLCANISAFPREASRCS
jgi:hypothetical protein